MPASAIELAARVWALLPLKNPPVTVDQVARLLSPKDHDIESAFRLLAFKARPLEDGLRVLAGWQA